MVKRLLSHPADFTYEEAKTLLTAFGYTESSKGKTSGSRVAFYNARLNRNFYMHKPHSPKLLKSYVINGLISELTNAGFIRR